jgi:hypothetical protein
MYANDQGADRLEHEAWLSVGQHSHWNPRIVQIAKEAILRRMDMPLGSQLPNVREEYGSCRRLFGLSLTVILRTLPVHRGTHPTQRIRGWLPMGARDMSRGSGIQRARREGP